MQRRPLTEITSYSVVDKRKAISGCADQYLLDVIHGSHAFDMLRADWERLWLSAPDATESQTWQWQYLYWKHVAPHTEPVIITVRDSGNVCVALASFSCCRDQSSMLQKAAFLGDKKPDYHGILAANDLPIKVGASILNLFTSLFKDAASYLELSNIPENSYTGRLFPEFCRETNAASPGLRWKTYTYAVALPKTLDDYLKLLGPRTRRDFRYDRRKLSENFDVSFKAYSTPETLGRALDDIELIDRARWGANSRYCVTSYRSFERSLAEALCNMGIYRALILYLDGIPRAFVTGSVVRNQFKVASIGFDRTVPAKWSIGKVSNFHAIEYCIDNGLEEYDLTRGGEDYKKWLGATPSTNLHWRQYRSRLSQMADSSSRTIISFVRRQAVLREIYQRLLRK